MCFFIIPWICSFVTGRQQCVRYNQELSDFKILKGGLPQGTKMGPLRFQVIINDAASDTKVSVWMWMTSHYLIIVLPSVTSSKIWTVLWVGLKIITWLLNPFKCQGLQVCFRKDAPPPCVSIDNVPLNFVNSAKILGVWIQDYLKWDKRVQEKRFAVACTCCTHF